ncbi:ATP-dependent zinc metalloprotease FTSH 12, chloroplastic isoform X1 [Senna tora]|uniref:ATP-dependent zinc metalloprotease FTSH 12, chloroplastic isoform X1 n=1 Tax=Senna tora TaxID=362788 RepID=A0A834WM75_9FABA|nr:ATP-dependent zinc metalloprotease FTSH 12, chloroplastic isoform X1 [Senna tora]
MDLLVAYRPNPLLLSTSPFAGTSQNSNYFRLTTLQRSKIPRRKSKFRALASANPNGANGFSWSDISRSFQNGSKRFWLKFGEMVEKETGFDLEDANGKVSQFVGQVRDEVKKSGAELDRFRTEGVPAFVSWNQWERWKDIKHWEPKRIGVFIFYIIVVAFSFRGIYVAIQAPYLSRQRKELTEAYMEALIPEPSPINIRRFKKGMWRKSTPKGLKIKKFIERPDGTLVHDSSYVGEDAWDDDLDTPEENVKQIIENDDRFDKEEKKKLAKGLGISVRSSLGQVKAQSSLKKVVNGSDGVRNEAIKPLALTWVAKGIDKAKKGTEVMGSVLGAVSGEGSDYNSSTHASSKGKEVIQEVDLGPSCSGTKGEMTSHSFFDVEALSSDTSDTETVDDDSLISHFENEEGLLIEQLEREFVEEQKQQNKEAEVPFDGFAVLFGGEGEEATYGEIQTGGTWRERLHNWREILRKERLVEQLDSQNAKYVVEFDMKEVENSLRKDVVEKASTTQGARALWISKRWWHYRPKLPYTYFLNKLDSSEVDIPLDPYLFEMISNSGVDVDLVQKRQIHYFMKVLIALLPGLLILCLIRESVMLLHVTSKRFLYKKYNQLFDMAYAENFILPVGAVGDTKSMYKEVVLGGDVWDLLDELMIYMGNPMQFYERGVQFVRGVLLSGPPGTGKTLFARTLSKESGLPFVFASGAEFTDSEKSGAARINEMFAIARRNAPCFVFVDEIDAIAGRHARKDPRRRATFEALIAQLDGEKEKTGVDRLSLRQAVIFICATNRPDELDLDFVRPGRIDRRLYIGLPDAKQRVQIFGVHSAQKQLAEDVDFEKLVFRTVGFSGADIRNLVNEAAIMSVRKGHSKIFQQDIVDVLDKQLLEGMGVLLTEEEQQKIEQSVRVSLVSVEKKRLLAVHEAGHVVLAHLFPRFDWHAFSQLLPGGKETAISVFYPREDMVDQGYTTFGYLKMQMVVAHGGRCAERVMFGDDITDGGTDDLEKITKIAREMVISPQNKRLGLTPLTKRVGLVDRPDSPDGELIRYRYVEETEELAMNALRDNRHILDMIARELLEKSRITGLEVEEKMKGMSPIMFEDFVKPFQINVEEEGPLPHNAQVRYQPLDVYPAPLHRC